MHGLINRSIQVFLKNTYGPALWADVARDAHLGFDGFEAMLSYDDRLTDQVLAAAARRLGRNREALLEDFGTFLVSDPGFERLRRLLRFGGVTFVDFLHSLDDLPGRGRLALPDLELPQLRLSAVAPDRYALACRFSVHGAGHVVVGLLRAMADDYGALAILEHEGTGEGGEVVSVHLLERQFAAGRRFDLASRAG
jgi:hypothetical protein